MRIALELAEDNHVYEDIATKFFEHFLYIAQAMNNIGGSGIGLWDEDDEFYYDVLQLPDGNRVPLKVRSMVGLIPLFAVEMLDDGVLPSTCPNSPAGCAGSSTTGPISRSWCRAGTTRTASERRLLSLLRGHRVKRLLRAHARRERVPLANTASGRVSKRHEHEPFVFERQGDRFSVGYVPGESLNSACSAATRTGAARSGCRSTTC